MRIIPKSIVRKNITKQIEIRNYHRKKLVSIPESLRNKEDYKVLKESESAIKAIADKNNLGFDFKNGEGLLEGQTILELSHQKEYIDESLKNIGNGIYLPGIVLEKVVSVIPKLTDKFTLIKDLNKIAANYPRTTTKLLSENNIVRIVQKDHKSIVPG